jgi:adenine phosphoribosyltransferase
LSGVPEAPSPAGIEASTSSFHDELVERATVVDGHADILGMLAERGVLQRGAAALADPFRAIGVTKVAGLEARGFIFAAAAALELSAGFVAIRKPGSIHPGPKEQVVTGPSWRGNEVTLVVQRAAIADGDRVLLVDDWAETGNQALGARLLIEACGGTYVGLSLLVDQLDNDTRERLAPVYSVVTASEFR